MTSWTLLLIDAQYSDEFLMFDHTYVARRYRMLLRLRLNEVYYLYLNIYQYHYLLGAFAEDDILLSLCGPFFDDKFGEIVRVS